MNEKTREKIKGALQIILSILIVILIFAFGDQLKQFQQYGYLGVFIISAISSATIFFPAPGWAFVLAMAKFLDPIALGVTAGVGSAIGEITGYISGHGVSKIISTNNNFKKIKEWIIKNDLLAIFVLAAVPNPLFDLAGIAAGSLGIKWWRFLIATAAGRIIRYVILAYLGLFTMQFV